MSVVVDLFRWVGHECSKFSNSFYLKYLCLLAAFSQSICKPPLTMT